MKTLEGTTVGILGGGQLGRMDILAGRRLGLRFCVYEPAPGATASRVADEAFAHGYEDTEALARFAAAVDVATLEFENVPRAAAELVAAQVPLRPNPHALSVCQHRSREKAFLAEHGFPCAPFEVVGDATALPEALARGEGPMRDFMLRQTRQADVELFSRMARLPEGTPGAEVPMRVLVPAFVTSELKSAFQIGFLVFVPFLIIDLVVASVLMSLGMMMLSPVLVALPFKLMLFVLADGWNLLMGSLAASFGG